MSWGHVVVEGYCLSLGEEEHPCKRYISAFCLGSQHSLCPHFGYAESNPREASLFVPLHKIIWDKMRRVLDSCYWRLRWWLWDRWHYDSDWIKRFPVAECPAWDNAQQEANNLFPSWLERQEGDAS